MRCFCRFKKRKHPTPEQYKKEFGEEVPDRMSGWIFSAGVWVLMEYQRYRQLVDGLTGAGNSYEDVIKAYPYVIACTPFGHPPSDWRPPEKREWDS